MKRVTILLVLCLAFVGCSGGRSGVPTKPDNTQGVIILAYEKPVDFKHFEVNVSTVANFKPTGWDGTAWSGKPNAIADWDGINNTLFMTATESPIQVTNLTPGVTYYTQVIVVDKSNQRSDPSPEVSAVAGDAQRSSTLVVAASDASPASRAGADFVCTGVGDQTVIMDAIAALPENGGVIVLSEGTFVVNDSIDVKSNVTIRGNNSTIKAEFVGGGVNPDIVIDDEGTAPIENFTLSNLKIDGQYSKRGTRGYLISLYGARNLVLENITGIDSVHGFRVNGTDILIYNCNINNIVGGGLMVTGKRVTVGPNNTIYDCQTGIEALGKLSSSSIKGNTIYNNRCGGMLFQPAPSDYNAISESVEVCENYVYSNSQVRHDEWPNIYLHFNCNNFSIRNNIVRTGDLANKPKYGIWIADSTCTNNLITNNDCHESGVTAGIYDAGTNTNFGAGNRNNNGTWSTTPN